MARAALIGLPAVPFRVVRGSILAAGGTTSPSIRSRLSWLVVACIVPASLAAAFMIEQSFERERALVERGAITSAQALMQTVDRDLASVQGALQALATSPSLTTSDFAAFHQQAREALERQVGNNIALTDATGQQLVNTLKPFGEALPRHGNPAQMQRVFEKGEPVISDLYIGPVARKSLIGVEVPVRRGNKVVYTLAMGIFPERLAGLLRQQHLPADWVACIFDSKGINVARTHEAEKFLGRPGPPALVQRMAQSPEGSIELENFNGGPVVMVFSRSSVSHWTVAIAIPKSTFTGAIRESIYFVVAGVAALLACGLLIARILAQRTARSIQALSEPALALGEGNAVTVPPLHLQEADQVGAALVKASKLLQQRNKALLTAVEEMETFSYSVAHDLRSPLRSIEGFGAALEEEYGQRLDDQGRSYLHRMREAARRQAGLIESLLELSKLSRRELRREQVNLSQMAHSVFAQIKRRNPGRAVELHVESNIVVWSDRRLMRSLLGCLLDNAWKFTAHAKPARIDFGGLKQGQAQVYFVRDNGAGFDMTQAKKLFQPFQRMHTPQEYPGEGIGLAIVARIISRCGGKAWAESAPGEGTTIYFTLGQERNATK